MEHRLDPARLGDHLDRLYRAAWALSGSREDAEDLVQETYARVLARPRLLRNEDDLGYLLHALRNTFLNRKRAESRRLRPAPLPDDLDLVQDPHAREPQLAFEAGELYGAIAELPEDFRDVLVAGDRPSPEAPRRDGNEPALPRSPAGHSQNRGRLRMKGAAAPCVSRSARPFRRALSRPMKPDCRSRARA
jgi:RNA polymerase sigma-70 factor (ECF subfamily)